MNLRHFGLALLIVFFAGNTSSAFTLKDGFEGPWYQPDNSFYWDSEGGFDDDWYVDHVSWVGDNQFLMGPDSEIKTEGEYSQYANSAYNDNNNPRDLYLARLVTGLEGGTTYTIHLDYRFDLGDPGGFSNHIQYDIKDGDLQSQQDINDIENYQGHERPETTYVDPATFDDGEFHTIETTHTTGENETRFTLMMIIRFCAADLEQNWLWLDNFVVTDEETSVDDWCLR